MFLNLTLLLPRTMYTGPNTEIPLNKKISKTVRANIVFIPTFDRLSKDMEVDRIFTCGSLVIDV